MRRAHLLPTWGCYDASCRNGFTIPICRLPRLTTMACARRSRSSSTIPTRSLLLVAAREPFGDKNRLRLAFSLDGDVPRHLHAPVDILDGSEPESRAHAPPGRNGAGEANAVQAVVDPQAHALDLDRLPEQVRQELERAKTVRDGLAWGRVPS